MSKMFEAIRQTLEFNASYDLVEERSDQALFLFCIPQCEDTLYAYVVSLGDSRTRVDICVPPSVHDSIHVCDILYKNILEQAVAISSFNKQDNLFYRLNYLFRRAMRGFGIKDARPINNIVYYALIANGIVLVLGIALIFDRESDEKLSVLLFLIALMWCVSIAAFVATGPSAKQSGRRYAILSIVFSFIVTIILIELIKYAKSEYLF
ncbi:hypothetical protein [Bifidobacterium italicum]|nr:hypothetical protein [Bifidobacterium italicum]